MVDTAEPRDRMFSPYLWLGVLGIVVFVFGGYELLERLYVEPFYPDLKYYLHIGRGVLTGLLTAVLAGYYLTSNPPFPDDESRIAGRVQEEIEEETRELSFRSMATDRINHWLIRMRWLACAVAGLLLFAGHYSMEFISRTQFVALLALFILVGLANVPVHYFSGNREGHRTITIVQVAIDLVAITVIVHLTGGVLSPFVFLYIFHVIISGMMYSENFSYMTSIVASSLFGAVLVLEGTGVLGHWPILEMSEVSLDGQPVSLYRQPSILLSSAGLLAGFFLVVSYLTTAVRRRLERERNRFRQELVSSGKMKVLRDIADGIAHEMGNSLNCLTTRLQLLRRKEPEDLTEHLDVLEKHAERIKRQIRAFVHIARPDQRPQRNGTTGKVNQAIRKAVEVLSFDQKGKHVELKTDLDENVPEVRLPQEPLEHVMLNLARNGMEAIPQEEGGTVSIQSRAEDGNVRVDVTDDGTGMDSDVEDRAFDPFFSTKKAGYGLGLFLVKRILTACGGEISVDSTPGEGTRCTVFLPC